MHQVCASHHYKYYSLYVKDYCYSIKQTAIVFYIFAVKPQEKSSSPERNPIGRRTESDRAADGIRSGGGRNLIGRRTENDDKYTEGASKLQKYDLSVAEVSGLRSTKFVE